MHVRKDLVERLSSGNVDKIGKREAVRRSKDLLAKFTQSPDKKDKSKDKRSKMKEYADEVRKSHRQEKM